MLQEQVALPLQHFTTSLQSVADSSAYIALLAPFCASTSLESLEEEEYTAEDFNFFCFKLLRQSEADGGISRDFQWFRRIWLPHRLTADNCCYHFHALFTVYYR